jgi:hypothetical protein
VVEDMEIESGEKEKDAGRSSHVIHQQASASL